MALQHLCHSGRGYAAKGSKRCEETTEKKRVISVILLLLWMRTYEHHCFYVQSVAVYKCQALILMHSTFGERQCTSLHVCRREQKK